MSVLRPDSWHWRCHWPGCDLTTRGAGPFCFGHYKLLNADQQAATTAALDAYRAELEAAVNAAAEAVRSAWTEKYEAIAQTVAPPTRIQLARNAIGSVE